MYLAPKSMLCGANFISYGYTDKISLMKLNSRNISRTLYMEYNKDRGYLWILTIDI